MKSVYVVSSCNITLTQQRLRYYIWAWGPGGTEPEFPPTVKESAPAMCVANDIIDVHTYSCVQVQPSESSLPRMFMINVQAGGQQQASWLTERSGCSVFAGS